MTKWLLLAGAIACEVGGTLALKGALEYPALYVVVVLGYIVSFTLLAAVLARGMPLGVAYGIWGALGVAATAILSTLIFNEPLTALMGVGMVLVVGGVLVVQFGYQAALSSAAEGTQ